MLTPEEQAFQDRMMNDGAAKAAHKEFEQPPKTSFLDMAKASGVDVQKIQKEVQDQDKKAEQDIQSSEMGADGRPMATQGDLGGAAKGLAQGAAVLAERAVNFGIDLADSAENLASDAGIGKGDLITGASQIDWASKLQSPEDSVTTRAVRNLTIYAAPVLATMGAGVGVAASLGIGAVSDLLLLDPHQERLSTMFRDNVPELKNYPTVYAAIDGLSNDKNESNMAGRLKNMVEGTLTAGATVGTFKGLSKLATKVIEGSAFAKNWNAARKAVPAATDAVTSTETGAVKIASEAELAANEAKISPPPDYNSKVVEIKPPVTAEGVQPPPVKAFNAQNDEIINFAKTFAKENPQDLDAIFSGPRPTGELAAKVAEMKKNPDEVQKLLAWTKDQGPLSEEQTKLAHALMYDIHDSVVSAAAKAADTKAPEDLLHLSEMIDTFQHVTNIETGAGTQAARTLNANKMGADLLGMNVVDYEKMLDQKAKTTLVKDLLSAHGGEEKLTEVAKQIKAINELPLGVAGKKVSLKDIAPLTGFQKTSKFIQSIAINGMLSSFTTPASNITSNALVNVGTMMENYMAAGIGKARFWGTKEVVTIGAANGYIRGQMGALFEGLTAAGKALKTGKAAGPVNVIKGDLITQAVADSSDGYRNLANKILGKVVEGTGLVVGLPSRINATADTFFGTIMYRGKQYERAITDAERLGLKGQELTDYIQKRISNVTVAEHNANSDFAQANTFSQALGPAVGPNATLAGWLDNGIANRIPMGKVLFPFFKTSANIVQYSVEHSPLSPFLGATREAVMRGGKDGDIAIAKVLLGTTMVGGAAYLASQGIITGPETRNPNVKRALEESGTGWQPDSIKIGDHYIGYSRIDPFNSVMRLGAVISSLANYTSEDDYQELTAMAGAAVMDFMTPEMMVDGYARFFDAYNEASRYGDKNKVAAVMADVANRFVPFGALQRDIKNQLDPVKRSIVIENGKYLDQFTDRVIARYKANSPFFSEDLPPVRNMFGDPLHPPDGLGPDMIAPFTITSKDGSWLTGQLAKLTGFKEQMAPDNPDYTPLNLEMPSKVLSVHGIRLELDPQQYDRYVMYSAGLKPDGSPLHGESGTLKSVLEKQLKLMGNVPDEMSPKQYHRYLGMISEQILRFRQMGQAQMLQDPDLKEKFYRAQKASQTKQTIDAFN
jgi:hypothetical protein